MARGCLWFWASLWRRKLVSEEEANVNSRLERRLTVFEVAALGVATTFGLGAFITTKEAVGAAGPSALVSLFITGGAVLFPALCFAELSSRLPLCGSGYIFSFALCGEIVAFIAGWSAILGHAAGATVFAKEWSTHLDRLLDRRVSSYMNEVASIDAKGFGNSFDPLAMGITLLVTTGLVIKTRHASLFNCVFTMISVLLLVVLFILAAMTFNLDKWVSRNEANSTTFDLHKFAPFGGGGILRGAEISFPAFIGFDVVATAVQESRAPNSAMPCGALIYLSFCTFFFALLSCGFTFTSSLLSTERYSDLAQALNWPHLSILVEVAALCVFLCCLFGTLFALSRAVFAMARDRLIFRCLAWTSGRLRTPVAAAIFSGLLVGSTSSLANMHSLQPIQLMTAGLLVPFSLAPLSLILLRGSYDLQKRKKVEPQPAELDTTLSHSDSVEEIIAPSTPMFSCCKMLTCKSFCYHLFVRHSKTPTPISQCVTQVIGVLLYALIFGLASAITFLPCGQTPFVISASVLAALCLLLTIILQIQPQMGGDDLFRMPFIPWTSLISIFITAYLMLQLTRPVWIRFGVWMAIGIPLYFLYGIANSEVSSAEDAQQSHKVSSWIMENRQTGHLGRQELSRITEQTDHGFEESMTRF